MKSGTLKTVALPVLTLLGLWGVYTYMKGFGIPAENPIDVNDNLVNVEPSWDRNPPQNSRAKQVGYPGQKYCHIYNGSQHPVNDKIECIKTKIDPSYTTCLHEKAKGDVISSYLRDRGMWEVDIFTEMRKMVARDPKLHFIDIGANIGVHSLGIASIGRKVVAVEPFSENINRFYKAAKIDGSLNRIKIVQNAISNTRNVGIIRAHPHNQGDTRIIMKNVTCIGYSCKEGTDTKEKIYSVLMDDLLEVIDFDRAVMKIDIQGYEHRAFQNASRLLDTIFIPVIFMEWGLFTKNHFKVTNPPSEDQKMVTSLIQTLLTRNFRPFQTLSSTNMLNAKDWNNWPPDMVWKYHIFP